VGKRNNRDRLKPPTQDTSTPTTATNSTDDLFSFVNPTEFVALPSEGRFYPEGHPLHNVDTIEIKHMTAKEEDILTSETLLKKGVAINRMVQSLIIDKKIKVESLLLGDKNAILIAGRITGFGPFYEVNTTCPSCYKKEDHSFDLSEIHTTSLPEAPSGVEIDNSGLFMMELPTSQVRVTLKLLTAADEEALQRNAENKKKLKKPSSVVTDLLKAIVVGANDHTDRETINKFVEMIPMQDVSYLRKQYEQVKPDMDVNFDFECPACSYVGEVVMPMSAEFFWPRR
tara:strand:+ start:474 stop:1328 length:855 start_codon:yes stop_codon:yes gene_type:complete